MFRTGKFTYPIVAVIGVILIVLGIISKNSDKDIEYRTVQGEITNITEDIIGEDREYHVYVTYKVAGTKYEDVEYGSYNSSMKVGDRVTVYYDPADPSHYQAKGFETVPYVFGGVGAAAVIFSVIMMIRKKSR